MPSFKSLLLSTTLACTLMLPSVNAATSSADIRIFANRGCTGHSETISFEGDVAHAHSIANTFTFDSAIFLGGNDIVFVSVCQRGFSCDQASFAGFLGNVGTCFDSENGADWDKVQFLGA